jgi:magnesium-transporting ATPase (P-type)
VIVLVVLLNAPSAQESSLTGEAQPVAKTALAGVDELAPLGGRTTAVFMNTMVARGRGEALEAAGGQALHRRIRMPGCVG